MEATEYDILKGQLQKILQNKPLSQSDLVPSTPKLDEIQQGLMYLSNCLDELNRFATVICNGELDQPMPQRHNYLVGGLKELHSVLRHLTWQTQRVASGDYQQRASFLGDFSTSFNAMVEQLDQRERQLKENTETLAQSIDLLKSIMDVNKDWIVVVHEDNGEVIYNNRPTEPLTQFSIESLDFEEISTLEGNPSIGTAKSVTYLCHTDEHYYNLSSYSTVWNERAATVHYISDITQQRINQKNLTEMAYRDALTGLYNRRYCISEMECLLQAHTPFSLVMIDINDLKYVNDEYSHEEGDRYILYVTSMMQQCVRDSDVVCRLGGDEFVLILKNCPSHVTQQKMRTLFRAVRLGSSPQYPMSISYGTIYVDRDNTRTLRELLFQSDTNMYRFKQKYKRFGGGQR